MPCRPCAARSGASQPLCMLRALCFICLPASRKPNNSCPAPNAMQHCQTLLPLPNAPAARFSLLSASLAPFSCSPAHPAVFVVVLCSQDMTRPKRHKYPAGLGAGKWSWSALPLDKFGLYKAAQRPAGRRPVLPTAACNPPAHGPRSSAQACCIHPVYELRHLLLGPRVLVALCVWGGGAAAGAQNREQRGTA